MSTVSDAEQRIRHSSPDDGSVPDSAETSLVAPPLSVGRAEDPLGDLGPAVALTHDTGDIPGRMIRRRARLVIVLASLAVGCVLHPRDQRTAPEITVMLTVAGRPAANREILYADGWSPGCSRVFARATSDSNGIVTVGPRRKLRRWRLGLRIDRLFRWHLCLASSPPQLIWEGNALAIVPERIDLVCSLDTPVPCSTR